MAKSRVRLRQLILFGKALGEALSMYTCRRESHPPASTLHSLTYFAKLNKGFRKVFLKLFTFNHAFHGTGFSKQFVAIECFCQDVRGLAVAASFASAFEVIIQPRLIFRVSDLIDDDRSFFFRAQATQVSNATFGNDNINVQSSMVDMATERKYKTKLKKCRTELRKKSCRLLPGSW